MSTDETNAIASNSYQIIGEPKYDRIVQQITNTSTVIIWKATVQVKVDDTEVRNWLKRDAQNRTNIVNQNNTAQQAAVENDHQIEDLRKRAASATNNVERARIKAEYQQADNEFLAIQKYNEGIRLYYQKNYSAALVKYNEAIKLNQNFAFAYINRGVTYATLKNYNQAINDYNKAIHLNPNAALAYHNRGNTYGEMGNYTQAIADFTKAIEINPNLAESYADRGYNYCKLGKF
ncbi:MAG: tetratricopeptide repeat protein [Selenomonadaceae bacterium]|nr:tetratricopeptide repeat protein [Selenomonadaceae bacterium]